MHSPHCFILLCMVIMCSSERLRLVFNEPSPSFRRESSPSGVSSYHRQSMFDSKPFEMKLEAPTYSSSRYSKKISDMSLEMKSDNFNSLDSNYAIIRPNRRYNTTHYSRRPMAQSYVRFQSSEDDRIVFPDEYRNRMYGNSREKAPKDSFNYDPNDPNGPSHWGKFGKACEIGKRQSPVAIDSHDTVYISIDEPLRFDDIAVTPKSIKIENSGHSVKINFDYASKKKPRMYGGPLKRSVYIFDSLHFHWGPHDLDGTEHELDGRKFASELHIVTYNSRYTSLSEAAEHPDGLSVLAFFYESSYHNKQRNYNSTFTHNLFVEHLKYVIEPTSSKILTNYKDLFSIKDLINNVNGKFYSYKGSLTTPNCNEAVTWIIMNRTLRILPEEVDEFRNVKDHRGIPITNNCRPLQDLNNRRICTNLH